MPELLHRFVFGHDFSLAQVLVGMVVGFGWGWLWTCCAVLTRLDATRGVKKDG